MIKDIIVVDNNPLIIKFMQQTLAGNGYQVRTAGDGLAALALMEESVPDAIFVDLVMPKISGDKLCQTMRNRPHLKDVRVIILSSLAAEEQLEMVGCGADAYIAKGPLKKCAVNVLSVLEQLGDDRADALKGQVVGVDGLHEREVTKELLVIKKHFEVIFDNMSEGIFEIADGAKIIYVNPAATYLVEMAEERMLAKSLYDFFGEENRARIMALVETAEETRQRSQGEEVELNGNFLSLSILPITTQTGPSVIVMAQDITERRRAQRALYKSAAQYRNLAEHSSDGICLVQDGRMKYVNDRLLQMGGYHLVDLVGVPITKLVPADSLADVQKWQEAFREDAEGAMCFDSRWLHKDGSQIEIECNVSATEYEGKRAALLVVRDVTSRKAAERELRQAHAFLHSVMDGMSESIMVIGTDYGVRTLNKAARELYAENLGDQDPEDLFCYQVVHGYQEPCDEESHRCPLRRIIDTGKPYSAVKTHTDTSGQSRSTELYATPVFDEHNELTGIIEVGRDITVRVREEESRKQLEAKLFRQQKDESISTLAGGIAHDFNNILTSVLGYAELLHRSPAVPEREQGLAQNVLQSVRRMVKLTRQMEAYIKRGKQEPYEIFLNTLIREVFELVRKEKRGGISYELELDDDLWMVSVDPSQLSQALINILTNAVEAIGNEVGTLTVRTYNDAREDEWECQSHVRLAAGQYVHVEIADTGPGIPVESLGRIFEPYYSTKFIGRGLGLAATLGIIRNHQGCVDVESSKEGGTIFHIYLPRAGSITSTAVADEPFDL
ncbi:PAS domain S-box protein [Thermodesulfobacteriota bacterium]